MRWASVAYVWSYNLWLLAWPATLCNDYSAESMVPLLRPTNSTPAELLAALPSDVLGLAEMLRAAAGALVAWVWAEGVRAVTEARSLASSAAAEPRAHELI